MSRNASDIQQKVKDNVYRIHSALGKWKTLNFEGLSLLSAIVNRILEHQEQNESGSFPQDVEDMCFKLKDVLDSMDNIVAKLGQKLTSFQALQNLSSSRQEQGALVFRTWTLETYESSLKQLIAAYKKELLLKKRILEQLVVSSDRSTLVFYTTAWKHQPYVSSKSELLVNAMVEETGL